MRPRGCDHLPFPAVFFCEHLFHFTFQSISKTMFSWILIEHQHPKFPQIIKYKSWLVVKKKAILSLGSKNLYHLICVFVFVSLTDSNFIPFLFFCSWMQSVSRVRQTGFCSRKSATCFTIKEVLGRRGKIAERIAKTQLQIWLLLTVCMNRWSQTP